MTTYATPLRAGTRAKNAASASMPPADAPMPTTRRGSDAVGGFGRSVCSAAFPVIARSIGTRVMTSKQIVVIGASAGGIEALRELVAKLPRDFAAAICVVLHTSPQSPGILD